MRQVIKRLVLLGVGVLAPSAFATSLLIGGSGVGSATEVFNNFGGNTGLTLTVSCGVGLTVGGNSCMIVDNGPPGNLQGLGVSSTIPFGTNHIQFGEFLQFTFSSPVTLNSLDIVDLDDFGFFQSGGKITNGGIGGTSIFGGVVGAYWSSSGWTAGSIGNGGAYGTHTQSSNNTGTIFDVFNVGGSLGKVFDISAITVSPVPEPDTLGLVGLPLAALGACLFAASKKDSSD